MSEAENVNKYIQHPGQAYNTIFNPFTFDWAGDDAEDMYNAIITLAETCDGEDGRPDAYDLALFLGDVVVAGGSSWFVSALTGPSIMNIADKSKIARVESMERDAKIRDFVDINRPAIISQRDFTIAVNRALRLCEICGFYKLDKDKDSDLYEQYANMPLLRRRPYNTSGNAQKDGYKQIAHLVIGPANAGKSYAIQHHPELSKLPRVDLYDVQYELYPQTGGSTEDEIWESYKLALCRLIGNVATYGEAVMEHTLLRAKRRAWYIEELNKQFPGIEIVCHYVCPDYEEYMKRYGVDEDIEITAKSGKNAKIASKLMETINEFMRAQCKLNYDTFEVPDVSEGFSRVENLT